MEGTLRDAFGESIANRTLNRLGIEAAANRAGAMVRAGSTAVARFNVSHREQPRWPESYTHDVDLSAQLHRNGFRTRDLNSDGKSVPKGCSLTFRARTTAPRPFKVYWQVVNTGSEASNAHDLRGQIIDAQIHRGGLTWDRENTKYTGMHWVECFIVKDGQAKAPSQQLRVKNRRTHVHRAYWFSRYAQCQRQHNAAPRKL